MSRRAILILVAILILAAVGAAGAYWYLSKSEPVACTQEAKLCPDGSYVGRTGPNCEFAVCPPVPSNDGQICIQVITPAKNPATGECREFPTPCDVPENWEQVESCETSVLDTSNWKTYRNEGYEFEVRYPKDWFLDIGGFSGFGKEAQDRGANHFSISSYDKFNNSYNPGAPVPKNEIKIEVFGFDYLGQSLEEWIKSFDFNSDQIITMIINGKTVKKILQEDEMADAILTIFFVDKNRGITFTAWPFNSVYLDEFYQIISTFKFLK